MTNIARRAGRAECNLCGDEYSTNQMGNHLAQELEYIEHRHEWTFEKGDLNRFLHVEIQHQRSKYFWMQLLVRHQATLGQLDAFLRAVWLECCRHLSRFDFHGLTTYCPEARRPGSILEDFDDFEEDDSLINWDTPVIRAMPPGVTGTHEYDFGSTTTLLINSRRSVRLNTDGNVMVIARNAPIPCDVCEKKPAETLTPTRGVLTDPDGQPHRGIIHVPLCPSCPTPAEPDDADEECAICDSADREYGGPLPMVNSPRLYDAECFLMTELDEVPQAPRLRELNTAGGGETPEEDGAETDTAMTDHGETDMHHECDDEDFYPGLNPIIDNVELWPNVLIVDSLLDSAGRFNDNTAPPDAIVRALDGLEKLALARTLCEETGDHHKYFEAAPDWTYTPPARARTPSPSRAITSSSMTAATSWSPTPRCPGMTATRFS